MQVNQVLVYKLSCGMFIVNTVHIFAHINPHLWVQTTFMLTLQSEDGSGIQSFCLVFKWSPFVLTPGQAVTMF